MANKKTKPCEDWEFLPQRIADSTKLNISEKNVVAALCYFRMRYRDYAKENDGWFYSKQTEIEEESDVKHAQINRILLKFDLNGIIQRKSGTTSKPTQYKLHPKIEELLLQKYNDTYVSLTDNTNDFNVVEMPKIEEKITNDTYVSLANDTQDKIREDKKRQEKSFLIDSTYVSKVAEKEKEVGSSFSNQQQFNSEVFYSKWVEEFKSCKTEDQLKETYKTAQLELPHNCEYLMNDRYIEKLQDEFNMFRSHLHFKKHK